MASIINSQIPEFHVQAYHDGKFKTISHADLKGRWSVFFFYPADFTFVCPTELGDMADKYDKLKSMGVEVYSVSTDTHFVHKAWYDASDTIKKIKFPMLADPPGRSAGRLACTSMGKGSLTAALSWSAPRVRSRWPSYTTTA